MSQEKIYAVIKYFLIYYVCFIIFDLLVVIATNLEYLNESNFVYYSYLRIINFILFFIVVVVLPQSEETKKKVRNLIISFLKTITFQNRK
jgi:hypothetical protein